MELREVFPEGIYSEQPFIGESFYTVREGERFFHLPKEQVSDRETALLQHFLELDESHHRDNIWWRFFNNQADLPIRKTDVQLILLQHSKELPAAMTDLLRELLPHLVSLAPLSSTQTLLVLAVADRGEAKDMIASLLPTLEGDFGLRLSAFVGNAWLGLSEQEVSQVLRLEYALFEDYRRCEGQIALLSFSQLLLWAIVHKKDISLLTQQLRLLMGRLKDSEALVLTLWQEQGNLVQTAQRLFIHRNSLQYRLDKYHQATGLNLKQLDDLALAYLLMLQTS